MLLRFQLGLFVLKLIFQSLHCLSCGNIFLQKLSVIVIQLFHIFNLIDHFAEVLALHQKLQVGAVTLFIHEFDPELHGCILLLLRFLRFLQFLCGGFDLVFLLGYLIPDDLYAGNGLN